jgi:UDP-N-acetylmuramoyl-tripeptide--D-alanyl-D-alanine ligase
MEAMKGEILAGDPRDVWSGAAIDSRAVTGGELFFALPGDHTDGHNFAAEALDRGAKAVVVHRDVDLPEGGAAIRVDDTFRALHDLTRFVRLRLPEKLVAITGSVGKSTTKELLAVMLSRRFRVARNPGNLNNLFGFPLSLLSIPEDTEWMVAEMGMSTPGELATLSRLGRPDAVVYTNVRPAHLEFFGSLRSIAEAKAELMEALDPEGLVVANADDAEVERIVGRHGGEVIRYGLESDVEHGAEEIEIDAEGHTLFVWRSGEERFDVALPLLGRHNVSNFLAAAACASRLGVPGAEIVEAAAGVAPLAMRGVVHRLGESLIIDDSYNSNPAGLREALASAASLGGRRHWAVLGDMLELGSEGRAYHRELGDLAARLGFSPILGVGPLARDLLSAARSAGAETAWYSDAAEAAREAERLLNSGDVVLVKGSRAVGLEAVVQQLLSGRGRF